MIDAKSGQPRAIKSEHAKLYDRSQKETVLLFTIPRGSIGLHGNAPHIPASKKLHTRRMEQEIKVLIEVSKKGDKPNLYPSSARRMR